MKLFKSRKFRQGGIATLLTVLGIAFIILFTSVFSTLANRFKWQVDMTKNQIFTITDETKEYLAGVDKDVTIYVLNSERGFTQNVAAAYATYFVQANEMIKNYADLSSHITVEYIDTVKNPAFVTQYPDETLAPNHVLVECEGRTKVVATDDLFNVEQTEQGAYISSSRAEQALTSAILRVSSGVETIVTVLSGYGEEDITAFTDLLELNNYTVTTTNILNEEIDPETVIALVPAPARDYSEDDLRKLDSFLDNNNTFGKTLFYMASSKQGGADTFPNLSAFLAEWGIAIGDTFVLETDTNHLIPTAEGYIPLLFSTSYTASEKQPELKADNYNTAISNVRPVDILFEQKSSRTTESLLVSSPESALLAGVDPETEQMQLAEGSQKSHSLLVLSHSLKYEGTTPMTSNVIALGSIDALSQQYLSSTGFANSSYYTALLDQVSDRRDTVRIESKVVDNLAMETLTLNHVSVIAGITTILLPLGLVITGLVVWLRRRHK